MFPELRSTSEVECVTKLPEPLPGVGTDLLPLLAELFDEREVETMGLEPTTSGLQSPRSSN